ncbi:hypothetical protein MLD38_036401 [Melastoma candidum]|uniref:Uncharacterized protein n=1 Tax=Melastoma candidum TaxID=119954 RepID=A0ACB9LK05_9MYRT|nr:hypothetical protein MLD38_036401 [Melastoma candidum]
MDNQGSTGHDRKEKYLSSRQDLIRCLRRHRGDDLKCVVQVKEFLLWRFKDSGMGPPLDSRMGIDIKDNSWEEAEALRRCLERRKGDHSKCSTELRNFLFSELWPRRNLGPLRLRRGSLTDV